MPSRPGRPTTSPRSRPILAGSTSTPPTILNPGRLDTCLRMAAPIGPRPKCITRMFGMGRIIARLIATSRSRTVRVGRYADAMIALMAVGVERLDLQQLFRHHADGASMRRHQLARGLVPAHHELAHFLVDALRRRLADANAAIGVPRVARRAVGQRSERSTCRIRRPCGARSRSRARCRCRRHSSSGAETAPRRRGRPSGSAICASRNSRECMCRSPSGSCIVTPSARPRGMIVTLCSGSAFGSSAATTA